RLQSVIRYVINVFCANGHTLMPKEELIKEASNLLTVSGDIIEENIKNASLDRKIKLEKVNDKEGVFTIPNYYCELGITN
ncbi:ATP-dependent RecD-like DNA helicase, partial [Clostridium perfringens]